MATRFGFRLVKAREDHSTSACQCDTCLRTRTACCHSAALRTWSGSLARWRKSEPSVEQRSFKRTIQMVPSRGTKSSSAFLSPAGGRPAVSHGSRLAPPLAGASFSLELSFGNLFSPSVRVTISLIDDCKHLYFDQLLRLSQFQNCNIGRRGLVVKRGEVRVDHRTRLADVAHSRTCPEDEIMNHVFKGRAGGIERLLDAIHCGAGLSLEIVDHVLLDLISFVGMVMINWQGCGPGEPKFFRS